MPARDLGRVQMIYKGDYFASAEYEALDYVSYNGGVYLYVADEPGTGITPGTAGYWLKLGSVVTDKSQALGGVSGNVTIDASLGNVVSLVRNGAITLSLTGSAGAGEVCVLTLVVTAGTSNADITWPDTVLWDHGAKPVLTNGGIDIFNLFQFNGADRWYGTVVGQDFAVPIS